MTCPLVVIRPAPSLVNVRDGKGLGIVFDGLTLRPGEVRDLGDVRAKPEP